MKIVAEYNWEYEAELAKGLLKSAGIEAVIMNVISPYPGVTMGRHGIELMVADEDLEAARKILENPEPVEG